MKTPKFIKKYLGVFLVFITVLCIQGCSTLVNGRTQSIVIQNNKDSDCKLRNTEIEVKKQQSVTLTINRSNHPLVFSCENSEFIYNSKITKEGYFSIAFIDFGMIDYLTGSLWEYDSILILE